MRRNMEEKAPIKLNIGGGSVVIPGYTTIDASLGHDAAELAYESCSVDEIYASHVLEHFSHREVLSVLSEWFRVLKIGGILKVAVPNFEWICDRYKDNSEGIPLIQYLMGGHVDDNDYHKCIFDVGLLSQLMHQAGFTDIGPFDSFVQDCSALPVSLNLQGRKASAGNWNVQLTDSDRKEISKIIGVMSLPRLGFTDNLFCVMQTCVPLGIKVYKGSGVFWGQTLTLLFSNALAENAKYILTIDYDTLFTPVDLVTLWRIIEAHPEIDALIPLQVRRESPEILMSIEDEKGARLKEIDCSKLAGEILPVRSGHFGLTLIRTSCLEKLEKPWFRSMPDKDGAWGETRVDEDVNFWLKMQKAGCTACICPRVVIGHMQMMATWPDTSLKPLFQNVSDYERRGKPGRTWR